MFKCCVRLLNRQLANRSVYETTQRHRQTCPPGLVTILNLKQRYSGHPKRKCHPLCEQVPRSETFPLGRSYHTTHAKRAKQYVESENAYAFSILQTVPLIGGVGEATVAGGIASEDDFGKFLDQNWRAADAGEIVRAFERASDYCSANDVTVSDSRFDKLVDGLMDNVDKMTTEELLALLSCLTKYPSTESYQAHNYHDIWSALDDTCLAKMKDWDVDTMFAFASLWYKLSLGRMCDYIFECLERLSKKAGKLTKTQLVHAFFYVNVCRKRNIDFQYEAAVEKLIDSMNVDEMAVIAMGFFKSKSKIKLPRILDSMIRQLKEERETVHEISLTAIVKAIRLSTGASHKLTNEIYDLLEHLIPQIPRFSCLACLHVAVLGTGIAIFHEKALSAISQKIVGRASDLSEVRLKDIERLLLCFSMFDFDPKTKPDAFETLLGELNRRERVPERVKHPRCAGAALGFLSTRNIYSYELMDEILNPEFLTQTYGKQSKLMPREIFLLDLSIDVECPDYKGNRLDLDKRYKAAKWLTEFAPSYDQHKKLSASDKLALNIMETVKRITGDANSLFVGHILPHFSKADIVLCLNKKTNTYVKPEGFENYILGDVMRPFNLVDYIWYVIVCVNWNMTVRNEPRPLGMVTMKERQLKTVGYHPVLVIWNEFIHLGKTEKMDYILSKMKQM